MMDKLKDTDKKGLCLKTFCIILCAVATIATLIAPYFRQDHKVKFDKEDDELITRALNLQSFQEKDRKKRNTDNAAFQEMGWKLSPEEAKAVFNAYYNCIWKRNKDLKEKTHIKAILALEGQTIKMSCLACFRPDQDPSSYEIEWQQLRTQDGVLRYVEETDNIKISDQKELVILQIDITDAGQYSCVQSNIQEYLEIYQLDVIFRERTQILPEDDQKDLLPIYDMPEHNLKVFTLWSEWSDCNECNKIGKRRKVGICMIQKLVTNKPVEPVDIPIIALYPDGIPCRSTVLPKQVSMIGKILNRRSETVMGNCFIQCPTTPAFLTITDSSGRIIETIDAGYHSMKNKPTLPPMVHRQVIFAHTREKIVLKCPNSSKKKKTMVRWQNGSIPLNPVSIQRQTRGRVTIDSVNRLHIMGLRKSDTAVYSCWLQNQLLGTIKVIITEGINPKIHTIITSIGVVLTIICVSLTCICTIVTKIRQAKAAR